MRLYLSSFRIGGFPERLLAMAGSGSTLALVPNALDGVSAEVRGSGIARDVAELRTLGFAVTETDLYAHGSSDRLAHSDVVWVRGGNVFVLRRAMADTGTDSLLVDLLGRDEIVYAGYSAGACVLAPDLRELEDVDDVKAVVDPIYRGLSVLDRPLVPHVRSPGHPENVDCDAVSDRLSSTGTAHWALRDGDVLVVEDSQTEVLRRPDV